MTDDARVPVTKLTMENNMKKLILAAVLMFTPAALGASKPKIPIGPMHCSPSGCTEVIRPW